MIENLLMHIYIHLNDLLKPLLCARLRDKHCKGHTKNKNMSGFSPLTGNTDKIASLIDETDRCNTIFGRVSFYLYKYWSFGCWPRGV